MDSRDRGNRSAAPRPRELPWRAVAIVGVVSASLFVIGGMWLRAEERDCEWECFNFPAVVLLLGLAGIVFVCLVVLAVMLGIWLVRQVGRTDDA